MPNQNQSRFWWTTCIVFLGCCKTIALTNSNCRIRVHYPLSLRMTNRSPYKLHSSSPSYYGESYESEKTHNTVVANKATLLKASTFVDDTQPASLSVSLINYICINQASLLLFASAATIIATFFGENPLEISSLHWNDAQEFHSLFDWQLSSFRFIEGILATIPIITLGYIIETSDNIEISRFNFATTNMVISLFGRRKTAMKHSASASFQVMVLSALIAISSGISEEIIFRGYIPTAISSTTHSLPSALFGQAILFACGHLSKNAKPGENKLNWSLQFSSGLWYGSVYLITGGDIFPCVIAHVLYDIHTLCEAWARVNNQVDYTQNSSMECISEYEKNTMERLQLGTGITLAPDTINFVRHFFYTFDVDRAGSLSLSDCQRAVSYAFMNDNIVPDTEVVKNLFQQAKEQRYGDSSSIENHDRLGLSEFLYLLIILRLSSQDLSQ